MADKRAKNSNLWPWLVGLVYLAAVALRAWRFACASMHADYANCGLLGQAMARGEFPIFFYGQDFMGSLDGLLAAPLYLLFGSSTWTLSFWPPVLSLLTMLMLHRLLAMYFSRTGVAVALVLMAAPPAMAYCWAGQAQTHYPLGIFLCAALLLLSALLKRRESWPWWLPFLWGLCAGAAVWTNFQTAVVVLPCGLFVLIFCWRKLFSLGGLWLVIGLLVGAGPLLYFNLTHDAVHARQAEVFSLGLIKGRLKLLVGNALPLILGFNPLLAHERLNFADPFMYPYLMLLGLAGLAGLALLFRAFARRQWFLLVPLALAGLNLGVLLFSAYGRLLGNTDQRYLLPLYLALPFVWAWLGGVLGRRNRWAAMVLAGLLVALHAGFYTSNVYCWEDIRCARGGFACHGEPGLRRYVQAMRAKGWHEVYAHHSLVLSFVAEDDPIFSDPVGDRRLKAAVAVDAAQAPVFQLGREKSFGLLGVGFEKSDDPLMDPPVIHSFVPPAGVEHMLASHGWSARGLAGADLGNRLWDRDLTTAFDTLEGAKPGQGLVLDLGREQAVGGVCLIPAGLNHLPAGLLIEAAGEDGQFLELKRCDDCQGPLYLSGPHPFPRLRYGRVESYWGARPLRYLRISHLGQSGPPWAVAEVLLWGPGEAEAAGWEQARVEMLREVADAGLEVLYADAWASAVVRQDLGSRPRTVVANLSQDDFGGGLEGRPGHLFLEPGPGVGLLVEKREAEDAARLLTRAGVKFSQRPAGRLVLFKLAGRQTPASAAPLAKVESPVDSQAASELAQGQPKAGRWGSQAPQHPGIELTLDMGRSLMLSGLSLHIPDFPRDYPRGLSAWVSGDGSDWREAELDLVWPLAFTGRVLAGLPGPESLYQFKEPVAGRYVRLNPQASHPIWWWSVQGVTVHAQ